MPLYKFKVVDQSGSFSEVFIDEVNVSEAENRLRGRRLTPVSFLGEGEVQVGSFSLLNRKLISLEEFTERLATLLDSGISLDESLEIIESTLERPQAKRFISDMRQGLHEGKKFSELVNDRKSFFPRIYKSLVEVGEESGSLAQVLTRLNEYLQEKKEIRSNMVSASIYPAFISFISFSVVVFMIGYIVPQFALTFAKAKKQPEGLAALLFDFSFFIRDNWGLLLLVLMAFVGAIIYFFRSNQFVEKRDRLLLSLPLVKHLVLISNLSTYFRTLGILLGNGVHLLRGVQIAERVLGNSIIRKELSEVGGQLKRGSHLSDILEQVNSVPREVTKMLGVGEKTGKLNQMMDKISNLYEKQLKQVIKNLLSAFEPLIIIFLGVAIGGIVIIMFIAISDLTTLS